MWDIELSHHTEVGLSQQIYISFKARILSGQIEQGEIIPSTRELARELGISRNTVCGAYDMLWTEGFIVCRQGAPSRVADGLIVHGNQWIEKVKEETQNKPDIVWDFRTGQPELTAFPWRTWNEMIREATESLSVCQFTYSGPKGYEPLCVEISGWLFRARGMAVDPKDIFITSGSTQALYLLIEILNCNCHAIALENPSHPGIRTVAADKGIPMYSMSVDEQGADIASLYDKDIAAVYVTPSHQFPLGSILPAARRAALIRLAVENEFYVIEDDYDSEFRYTGSPVSPIYTMDPSCVVYVGTFSKTMFPALRLGFAVLPKPLQEQWRHVRTYMDVQNPILEQAVLARFLRMRKMDKHIRQMRRLYGEKRRVLSEALQSVFGDTVVPWGDASGLHIALQFPGHIFNQLFIKRCKNAGMRIVALSQYCFLETEHLDKLLIGYGHLSSDQIKEGIKKLAQLIHGTGNH